MKSRDEIMSDDVRDLACLGYAQQLYRQMGGFSNFAVSFSISIISTGCAGQGMTFGTLGAMRAARCTPSHRSART